MQRAILEDITTNENIKDECKRLKLPLRFCWFKSALPAPAIQDGGYILNLADSYPGTHWCLLYKEGPQYAYFDSYGVVPPLAVLKAIGDTKKYYYNSQLIQGPNDGQCGLYCIECLQYLHDNKKACKNLKNRFQNFINLFHDKYTLNKYVLAELAKD